jgi:uncharacterized protein YbcI
MRRVQPYRSAVANAVNRIHRESYGRGATTARTALDRNYLTVYLEDIYTPAERTLIDGGRAEQVKETRQAFQMTMAQQFIGAAEEITGRKVIAFMSQVHFNPDMAAEIFVFEPSAAENKASEETVSG